MPDAIAIIPARFGSTRFPGKPLADATGKPLIQHVYEQASRANSINRVIIATDDRRIADAVTKFGGEAVMTRADHPNGTSRLAEVAQSLDCETVVNVQGDEPEIDPAVIDLAVDTLHQHIDCVVATIASPFADDEDPTNHNIVKVVCDRNQRALLFSRSVIPHDRDKTGGITYLKHIGLYVYRRPFLLQYVQLESTPLERAEQLEQLRILEHGHEIAVAVTQTNSTGIDTPEQYEAFVKRWQSR